MITPSAVRATVLALLLPFPALAGSMECPTEGQHAELRAFRDRIADAPSTDAAKDLALRQTRRAHKAIHRAARMVESSEELAAADAKLTAFEAGVRAAESPEAVALQFDTLAASPTAARCDYTGVEILIIVLGFILGIIPGIIFLLLFC